MSIFKIERRFGGAWNEWRKKLGLKSRGGFLRHRRSAAGGYMAPWVEQNEELVALWRQAYEFQITPEDVAARLRRTLRGVRTQARKLGLPLLRKRCMSCGNVVDYRPPSASLCLACCGALNYDPVMWEARRLDKKLKDGRSLHDILTGPVGYKL